jgi:long-chain acyl-CoA synthetase
MSEAMVIGDNRPSLSALLWLKEGSVTPAALEEIDRSVCRVNGGLSHPEQVKRWAILADSPAMESGELTGNLKLRRQVVLARRAGVVEMLYGRRGRGTPGGTGSPVPGVLHVGESQCA